MTKTKVCPYFWLALYTYKQYLCFQSPWSAYSWIQCIWSVGSSNHHKASDLICMIQQCKKLCWSPCLVCGQPSCTFSWTQAVHLIQEQNTYPYEGTKSSYLTAKIFIQLEILYYIFKVFLFKNLLEVKHFFFNFNNSNFKMKIWDEFSCNCFNLNQQNENLSNSGIHLWKDADSVVIQYPNIFSSLPNVCNFQHK